MGDALAPWHIILVVVVFVLLFGARRLPGAAKSLGESMHIFKKSVQGLNPDDAVTGYSPAEAALAAPPDAARQQLADLQRQVADLQRQSATVGNAQAGHAQPDQTGAREPR